MLRKCLCGFENNDNDDVVLLATKKSFEQNKERNKERNEEKLKNIVNKVHMENKILVVDLKDKDKTYLQNKTFRNKIVCIINGTSQFLIQTHVFVDALVVFLFECDKEFIFFNINKHVFPNLYNLYCTSHPYNFGVMHRLQDNIGYTAFIVEEHYNQYHGIWWDDDTPHIKSITKKDILNEYDKYTITIYA